MITDITFCAALFCPLSEDCLRKSYIGKPYIEIASFSDFSDQIVDVDEDNCTCDYQIKKEQK